LITMKPKFVCSLIAAGALLASAALAQTGSNSSAALPAAPGTANDPAVTTLSPTNKAIVCINVEQAIFASNEGQRDMDALGKKFEPKSSELKGQNDEIDALKKKLSSATAEDVKADLQRQIETKQKSLDRAAQDAREDFQTQQNEIGQRILQKMAQVIIQVANENGAGMIVDVSQPWPQGPVLASGAGVDITKAVVDAYNAKSGIAPPAPRSGSTGAKPSGTTPRSAPASKPATTTPPAK
jgi:Skp family chaperone for outer membrane proteins